MREAWDRVHSTRRWDTERDTWARKGKRSGELRKEGSVRLSLKRVKAGLDWPMGVLVRLTNPCTQAFSGTFEVGPACRGLSLPQARTKGMTESKALCGADIIKVAYSMEGLLSREPLCKQREANVTLIGLDSVVRNS